MYNESLFVNFVDKLQKSYETEKGFSWAESSAVTAAGTVVLGTAYGDRSGVRVLLIEASPRAGVRPLRRPAGSLRSS